MGRAPCCEKVGLKKGAWSPEEDLILINYINKYGHNNWRALPQQAGLLRCGKSCRLRWTNYLRPDIKRGNFTREEEDTIIHLHDMLGNRWSAIAAKLQGRTDNEIKNVWHTHLKKRLQHPQNKKGHHKKQNPKPMQLLLLDPKQEQEPVNFPTDHHVFRITETIEKKPLSTPQCSSSDMSTLITRDTNDHNTDNSISSSSSFVPGTSNHVEYSLDNLALDEEFWSEVLSADNSDNTSNFPTIGADLKFQFPLSSLVTEDGVHLSTTSSMCDGMDFWYDDVYARAEESPELCC